MNKENKIETDTDDIWLWGDGLDWMDDVVDINPHKDVIEKNEQLYQASKGVLKVIFLGFAVTLSIFSGGR